MYQKQQLQQLLQQQLQLQELHSFVLQTRQTKPKINQTKVSRARLSRKSRRNSPALAAAALVLVPGAARFFGAFFFGSAPLSAGSGALGALGALVASAAVVWAVPASAASAGAAAVDAVAVALSAFAALVADGSVPLAVAGGFFLGAFGAPEAGACANCERECDETRYAIRDVRINLGAWLGLLGRLELAGGGWCGLPRVAVLHVAALAAARKDGAAHALPLLAGRYWRRRGDGRCGFKCKLAVSRCKRGCC